MAEPLSNVLSRRMQDGARSPNALQLGKYLLVGSSGYVVNLAVFVTCLRILGLGALLAASCSFLVSVANNYTWNRAWTFRCDCGAAAVAPAARFLTVSIAAYGINVMLLTTLIAAGVDATGSQAVAILVVAPLSFTGNKLWTFRKSYERGVIATRGGSATEFPKSLGALPRRRYQLQATTGVSHGDHDSRL
jgi:putative flippase GtrA